MPKTNAKRAPARASRTIRKKIRATLDRELRWFLAQASQEELWFFNEVLNTRNCCYSSDNGEVGIASAFENCISGGANYIAVEPEFLEPVKEFVEKYTKSGGRLQPVGDGWHLWRAPQGTRPTSEITPSARSQSEAS